MDSDFRKQREQQLLDRFQAWLRKNGPTEDVRAVVRSFSEWGELFSEGQSDTPELLSILRLLETFNQRQALAAIDDSHSVSAGDGGVTRSWDGPPDPSTHTTSQPAVNNNEQPNLPTRFRVTRKLGSGSYGVVYLAWDTTLRRDVAIKVPQIQSEVRNELLREAQAASRLKHPRIVRVYDVGEFAGQTFIVSDFIDGQTLGRWTADRSLTVTETVTLIIKLAEAVEFAHQGGVIHRDLKPGNIMMDAHGDPHILDFGLSHSRDHAFKSIAKTGSPVGTPAFMSPEQVQGQLDRIDTWTDVYALGVILYQLLTKTLPFSGLSDSIYEEICHRPPIAPRQINRQIPPALEAITLKAMAKNIDDRYPTAQAFADELRRFQTGQPVLAYRHWEARVVKAYTRRFGLLAMIVVLVVALALSWWFWRNGNGNQLQPTAVIVETKPSGAQLTWILFDPQTATWQTENARNSRAGEAIDLTPGRYKVVAISDQEIFEVQRTVPQRDELPVLNYLGMGPLPHLSWQWQGNQAVLPVISIIPVAQVNSGMVYCAGMTLELPQSSRYPLSVSGKSRPVSNFLIDAQEITVDQFLSVFPNAQFAQPSAATVAIQGVTCDQAIAYAERVGKSLPSLWEYLVVATNHNQTQFPWGAGPPAGQASAWIDKLAERDLTTTTPPVSNLLFPPAEWTEDALEKTLIPNREQIARPADPQIRHIFGFIDINPSAQQMLEQAMLPISEVHFSAQSPPVGFRCVRRLK